LIIWDEYEYGETLYHRCRVNSNKWQLKELKALIFYMLENNFSSKDIREKLLEVCNDEIKYLSSKQRESVFNKLISQCKSSKTIRNIKIDVYKTELDNIRNIDNPDYEKCVFIMLIYKKWLDKVNELRNRKKSPYYEWFSLIKADIFKEAGLSKMNGLSKQSMLNYLYLNEYIKSDVKKLTKSDQRIENIEKKQMWSVPFIKYDGEVAFSIDDFRNVINQYINYRDGGFSKCGNCGILFSPTNNRQKYCADCRRAVNREKTKHRMRSTRNV